MVTISDIAEKAGVAKSTVSNALKGTKFVSEPLKERILKVCDEMNYSPNFYASGLSGHRTNIIGLFLEETKDGTYHAYYTELIEACLRYVSKHGYNLLIYYNLESGRRQNALQKGKSPIDGAIISAPLIQDHRILQIENNSTPCVSIGKPSDSGNLPYVDIDNVKLIHDAVNILAVNGYDKIYLVNSDEHLSISRERSAAFLDAKRERGLSATDADITYASGSVAEEGRQFAEGVIRKNVAFITANTRLAEGVYAAAEAAGLGVGREVGVFALGGEKNDRQTPNLAYASQDYARLAKMAAKCLIRQLDGASGDGQAAGESGKEGEAELIASKIHFDASVNRG